MHLGCMIVGTAIGTAIDHIGPKACTKGQMLTQLVTLLGGALTTLQEICLPVTYGFYAEYVVVQDIHWTISPICWFVEGFSFSIAYIKMHNATHFQFWQVTTCGARPARRKPTPLGSNQGNRQGPDVGHFWPLLPKPSDQDGSKIVKNGFPILEMGQRTICQ